MEDFSVSQLKKFHHHSNADNTEKLDDIASDNIGYSRIRNYDIGADLSKMDEPLRISNIIHDTVVDIYEQNEKVTEQEAYNLMRSEIEAKADIEEDYSEVSVYQSDLDSAVKAVSENIAENFNPGRNVKTEEPLENQSLRGRADIIRDVDGETELRDIKTRYSSEPRPYDEFGLACYALLSRADLDVDRFVLEYPVQGFEVEINPEDWFSLIVDRANEFEEMLEETREVQADQIREFLENSEKSDREKVEKLGLNPKRSRELAREARSEI